MIALACRQCQFRNLERITNSLFKPHGPRTPSSMYFAATSRVLTLPSGIVLRSLGDALMCGRGGVGAAPSAVSISCLCRRSAAAGDACGGPMGAWRETKKRVSDGRVDGRRKPGEVVIILSHKGTVSLSRRPTPSRPLPLAFSVVPAAPSGSRRPAAALPAPETGDTVTSLQVSISMAMA